MNRDAPGTRKQGSWLMAWLGGSLVALGLTLVALLGWMSALSYSNTSGFAGDPILMTFYAAPYLAVAAGFTFFLVIMIMALAEIRTPRPLSAWLFAALFAIAPAAFVVFGLLLLGDSAPDAPPTSDPAILWPPLGVLAFGLCGGAVAFRIRHRSWR